MIYIWLVIVKFVNQNSFNKHQPTKYECIITTECSQSLS